MNRREPTGFNFTRTGMWPLWFPVLLSTCILSIGALRFTFLVLNIIYKWVHHIKLLCLSLSDCLSCLWTCECVCVTQLCTHVCLCDYMRVVVFVFVLAFLSCVCLGFCLPPPRPALSLTLTLFLSPFLYHPFTLPHPHPLALPPLPSAITVLT